MGRLQRWLYSLDVCALIIDEGGFFKRTLYLTFYSSIDIPGRSIPPC